MENLEEHQTLLDEMRIKDGLVYNKHEARIEGFVVLGKVNNTFSSFQQSIKETSSVSSAAGESILKHAHEK